MVEFDHFRIPAGGKDLFLTWSNSTTLDYRLVARLCFNMVEFDHFRISAGGKALF
jgi:hypothetical protein